MSKFYKLHKLHTYTDKSLIKVTPNEILVYVYARAELSDVLAEMRHFPREAVIPQPIAIEVRFSKAVLKESTSDILASAESLAQVAAVSPDFFNIFGSKKGVNITDLLLVTSQQTICDFAQFIKGEVSIMCNQSLSLSSVYFYGAATRLAYDSDWAIPLLAGEKEPYAIYNTSARSVFDRFCIENKYGKFFITRVAIEDYLSLPHRFEGVETVTRPFKGARGVLGQELKEPIAGSPYAPSSTYNEKGLRNKVFLAPGIWKCRLVMIEEVIFGEPVYIVKGMPPYIPREEMAVYTENGADHFENSKKIRDHLRLKQKLACEGELG